MKYIGLILSSALLAAPSAALAHDPAAAGQAVSSTPEAALAAYRDAIENLDASGMSELFTPDSRVFENGKAEGSFANYLGHHLGPELGEFVSFDFDDLEMEVKILDDIAVASETYRYTIKLKDGRIIERQGAATSTLVQQDGGWKIMQYHSSSRTPKKAK